MTPQQADIKVIVDIPNGRAIELMQMMAREIVELYRSLDEVAAIAGGPPYPRNQALIDEVEAFAREIQVKHDPD